METFYIILAIIGYLFGVITAFCFGLAEGFRRSDIPKYVHLSVLEERSRISDEYTAKVRLFVAGLESDDKGADKLIGAFIKDTVDLIENKKPNRLERV